MYVCTGHKRVSLSVHGEGQYFLDLFLNRFILRFHSFFHSISSVFLFSTKPFFLSLSDTSYLLPGMKRSY